MKSEMFFIRTILKTVLFICLLSEVFCVPQYYRARTPRPNRRYRRCQAPDETFFDGQCLLIGSTYSCPNNMQLFDGLDNEGFCDCVKNPPAFDSHETGECSFQNTQGPCLDGEWFLLKNNVPQCEPVPDGCPADGQHFYGTPDDTMDKQCWEIGSQGPCLWYEILQLEEGTGELKLSCKPQCAQIALAAVPSSAGSQAPCRLGTWRNQFGQCKPGFIG